MRLFVAIDLPAAARQEIARVQQRVAASVESVRLVKPEQLHITLVFLGDVSDAQVPVVVNTMSTAVGMISFDLVFSGLGVFPPRGAPRACWIGVTEGVNALVALQKTLADRIEAAGIPLDPRPYRPPSRSGAGASRAVRPVADPLAP